MDGWMVMDRECDLFDEILVLLWGQRLCAEHTSDLEILIFFLFF